VPRLCEFNPGICLTTEEKARKKLSQGSRRVLVYILNITKTPTQYKTHTPTHHKTTQTTTVQITTNPTQDIPNCYRHNIMTYPQYKVTLMYTAPLST
jgi:CMP-N-acetylneuraminic acid synthetase